MKINSLIINIILLLFISNMARCQMVSNDTIISSSPQEINILLKDYTLLEYVGTSSLGKEDTINILRFQRNGICIEIRVNNCEKVDVLPCFYSEIESVLGYYHLNRINVFYQDNGSSYKYNCSPDYRVTIMVGNKVYGMTDELMMGLSLEADFDLLTTPDKNCEDFNKCPSSQKLILCNKYNNKSGVTIYSFLKCHYNSKESEEYKYIREWGRSVWQSQEDNNTYKLIKADNIFFDIE